LPKFCPVTAALDEQMLAVAYQTCGWRLRSAISQMRKADGTVLGVSSNAQHAFSKSPKPYITLVENHGVEGDAHAGRHVRHRFIARVWPARANNRQVHLIRAELFEELSEAGHSVGPGDLGENITTSGVDLEHLPLGTRLYFGETAVVELTGLRTPCALIDRFQKGLRSKMISGTTAPKFKCGVHGVVLAGGRIEPGDDARVEAPSQAFSPLPAL
jgi:MOSC domain-containing protein YiiM